ncbi:CGNR zinc finger domain-containing protein [Nonomuraea sp. MG754425]|uniref:CGNR zinc finger domain-containing protein n=1 Tax=Nonomuraea sp. MG754425 TaxID=2570319 RepID=UPI002351AC38|nr:CGNR zinc finger domain-containing protein [Nonomuraea sp. MG754425]
MRELLVERFPSCRPSSRRRPVRVSIGPRVWSVNSSRFSTGRTYGCSFSRNRRRTWCSMDVCGNRAKASASHSRKTTARP